MDKLSLSPSPSVTSLLFLLLPDYHLDRCFLPATCGWERDAVGWPERKKILEKWLESCEEIFDFMLEIHEYRLLILWDATSSVGKGGEERTFSLSSTAMTTTVSLSQFAGEQGDSLSPHSRWRPTPFNGDHKPLQRRLFHSLLPSSIPV